MNTEKLLMWIGFFIMLIGWAVMFAAGVLPDLWAAATLAILGMLYGLPTAITTGKKVITQLKK